MAYTNIPKPTGTNYTVAPNSGGVVHYDESSVMYDDPNTFYDGYNPNAYINISKPSGGTIIATAGLYYGFGAFTYSGGQILSQGQYTKVPKPN